MTRRKLLGLIPGVVVVGNAVGSVVAPAEGPSLPSAFFPFEAMALRRGGQGQEFRDALKGKIATGEVIEAHATTLPVDGSPHPPHRHLHSEMWLIREGTVEIMINGKKQRLGPGSMAFVASQEEHGIRNVGKTPTSYFVVSIGPGADGSH